MKNKLFISNLDFSITQDQLEDIFNEVGNFIGIVIALPLTIILLSTYRFYEDDISQKIEDVKNKIWWFKIY